MKRCVFVSGGAKGIGRACVELFASRGWQVAFMDVDADAGRELAGSLAPLPVIFLRGSTCSRQDVESAIAEAAANFGGLGCVVANAGIHRSDTILDVSPEQLRQVVDTNIFGTINTMQAALPAIIASGGGSAVIVASDQSTVGKAHSFSYGLTKGALGQMARQTAIDMAPHGIRVNAVCPSTIATPLVDDVFARSGASPDAIAAMWEEENALFLRGSCGQPAEVASMVFFLASEEAGFCTGGLYPVDADTQQCRTQKQTIDTMPIKVGDTVRFLNAVGGGVVVKIDGKVAHVREDDGFETPVLASECVAVAAPAPAKPATAHSPAPKNHPKTIPSKENYDLAVPKAAPAPVPVVETPGGDVLNLVIGFEPTNIKALGTSDFETYVVNDSNYFVMMSVATRGRNDRTWAPRWHGVVEPNMQDFAWELAQSDLPAFDRMLVQAVAFKSDREFEAMTPVNVEIKVDATKFARLHCFRPGTYFDSPAIAFDIVRNGHPAVPFEPDAEQIRKGMASKENTLQALKKESERRANLRSSRPSDEPLVVDLHSSEILDSTAGMGPADILNYQIEIFARTMDANLRQPGRKIVFIHGKGNGVLRAAIEKELSHRYKGHRVQDASFREYGFGATQVTISASAGKTSARR